MDEDMSPRFSATGFGTWKDELAGGVWTVLEAAGMFGLLELFRRDR